MTTLLYSHDDCLNHDPGAMHPENPNRLRAIKQALGTDEFDRLIRREAPKAEIADLCNMHPEGHVTEVLAAEPKAGMASLDADTHLSPGSADAALRSAGAAIAAVDAVMAGDADNAFCAARPPGHHAEPSQAMGFCLFNNVAIAGEHGRKAYGMERIAVVDFDVHHGNGTEAMFKADPDLFFASTHQMPLYPGTGSPAETGVKNNIVNAPLSPMSGGRLFREAMSDRVLPSLRAFNPDFLIISAGFDAHRDDPLAQLELVEDDYVWITNELRAVADQCCDGRLISCLEGGYNLEALGASVAAHVRTLMA